MSNNQQIIDIMSQLRDLGCRIYTEGDKLRLRTAKNKLPAELTQEIKAHKAEILAFLNSAKDKGTVSQEIPKLRENAPQQLSFAQQRLWFLGQLEDSNATYNMPMSLQLDGKLNFDALYSSFAYIVERHSSLRSYFPNVAGQPQIQIKSVEDFDILTSQDLRNLDQETQSAKLQKLINDYIQEPFNLNTGPLFKAKLLQLKEDKFALLINMHHIVSDGWSMGIFVRELRHAYSAFDQGKKPTLEPLPIQYSDFATWQRNWLQGKVLDTQLNYWQEKLRNAPPLLELPTDHPRPALQSYRGSHYSHTLSPELTEKLNTLSQQQGVSLYMLLLAAFNLLLSRYSRQDDLCIGSPVANRTHGQTEGLIGFFVNTLVLRSQIKTEQSFIEFLKQTRQTCLDAYAYQDIPFELLVEQLKPDRSMSYNPLFQVMFALENNDKGDLGLPGLNIQWLSSSYPFAKFDLSVLALESNGQLDFIWEYATDLFEPTTIQRMTEHWLVLLQGIVDNPQQTIDTLPWLTEADQEQLEIWNQTDSNYPQDKTLVDLFEEQAKQTPDNIALVFEQQRLTYKELNQKANQVAHYLQQNYQIKPDTLIGICVDRSLEMIIGLLGVLKAGAAYVPIDPEYPEDRIKFILEDSGIEVLLTQSFIRDKSPLIQFKKSYKTICLDQSNFDSLSSNNLTPQSKPNDLAYVIYTSGSTGRPKGVMIEHRGLTNIILAIANKLQVEPQTRWLQIASFSFDMSLVDIAVTLVRGARLYLIKKEILLSGQNLFNFISQHQIAHLHLSPSLLSVLPNRPLPALQNIATGGEAIPAELVKQWGEGRNFFNGYGPTESTITTTIALCETNGKTPPIGKPVANTRVYILDSNQQILPPGIPGELCIAGVGLARGYLHRPDLTAEKFIEVNILGKTEKIYKTGELAKWGTDGNVEFLGRIDQQVQLRGFRIELGEIEAILLKHSLVKEAVINLYKTENNQQLVAYVTVELINNLDHISHQLKQHLKSHLPDYMIPSQIMVLDRLPLTPNGKIDRKALPTPNIQAQSAYKAPRNEVELQLAQIWSLVLDRPKIGIDDNFFDLGGHSLLAVQLLNHIQENFEQKLDLSSLFQNPTIAQLALQLSPENKKSLNTDLLVLQPLGEETPIYCVAGANGHAFYFRDLAMNFAPSRPVYGLETPGRDRPSLLPTSIEAHASSLIKTLQQQQPQGPYILTGYSSGCAIALEMAYQLEQQGETISLLGIFDAGLVANPGYITQRSDLHWIWHMIQRVEAVKGISLGLEYEQLEAQPNDEKRWDIMAEASFRHNVLPEHSSLSLLKTNLEVMKKVTLNYAAYQPNFKINAPIVLFRAEEAKEIVVQEYQGVSDYHLPDWGWQAYSNQLVKIMTVSWNHCHMLSELRTITKLC